VDTSATQAWVGTVLSVDPSAVVGKSADTGETIEQLRIGDAVCVKAQTAVLRDEDGGLRRGAQWTTNVAKWLARPLAEQFFWAGGLGWVSSRKWRTLFIGDISAVLFRMESMGRVDFAEPPSAILPWPEETSLDSGLDLCGHSVLCGLDTSVPEQEGALIAPDIYASADKTRLRTILGVADTSAVAGFVGPGDRILVNSPDAMEMVLRDGTKCELRTPESIMCRVDMYADPDAQVAATTSGDERGVANAG